MQTMGLVWMVKVPTAVSAVNVIPERPANKTVSSHLICKVLIWECHSSHNWLIFHGKYSCQN